MAKYSKGAQKGVESAMKLMEKGDLESGRSGKKVTNPKQAIAIGLSEARKKGAKAPAKAASKSGGAKKSTSKKAEPKKAAAKKAAPKKRASKAAQKKTSKAAPKKTSRAGSKK